MSRKETITVSEKVIIPFSFPPSRKIPCFFCGCFSMLNFLWKTMGNTNRKYGLGNKFGSETPIKKKKK